MMIIPSRLRARTLVAFISAGLSTVALAGCWCWCWCLGICNSTDKGSNPEHWRLLASVVRNYGTGYYELELAKLEGVASDSDSEGEAALRESRPSSPSIKPPGAKRQLQFVTPLSGSINVDELVDVAL